MNSTDGRVKANAAVVPAGYQGAVSVFVTDTTNVILDIDGYFAPPASGMDARTDWLPCQRRPPLSRRRPDFSLGQVTHIVDELVKRKIRFTAIQESIHFEGKQDLQTKVMVALFGLFAEVERDLISERTREGLASTRAKGRLLGRPKGSLGKSRLDGKEDLNPHPPAKASIQVVHRQDRRRHAPHHSPLYRDAASGTTGSKENLHRAHGVIQQRGQL